MKLTKSQFCKAVNTYQSMLEEEFEIINLLDISPDWKPNNWIENYYDFLSNLCDLDSNSLYGTTLDWFCYEANFGQDNDSNKIFDINTNRTWHIKSPDILYDYIMEVELEEY